MIGKTNVGGGGGSGTAWAYIAVTYPEGSTCSATNGSTTLSAQGTSGLYVFHIPEPTSTPETWTVSCTNGTKTKSETVEISAQYQSANVLLRYSRLPEGYQEVEYLESDGHDQYIDPFGAMINPYAYEFELTYINLPTKAGSVCGWANASTTQIYIGRLLYASSSKYDYYFQSAGGQMAGNVSAGEKATVIINNDNNQVVENDVVIGTLTGSTGQSRPILFATALLQYGQNNSSTARIFSFSAKNKQSGIVEKNYVPCYRTSDDVAGFYDLANNTFVQNDGYGSFTVGADV